MKKFLSYVAAMATVITLGLTSCHSDDNDDFEPLSPDDKELVSSDVPDEGWSGNSLNGVFTYAPGEYDADEPNSYFAFRMQDGICRSAAMNIVMENSAQANRLAQMLNNGTWVSIDDDDDDYDDEDYYSRSGRRAFDMAQSFLKLAKQSASTRADGLTLPIPVRQDGRVIYIILPNFTGLDADDLREIMDLWTGNGYVVPDRVIFGKYQDGVYTCDNMHGLDIDYRIETEFNSAGFCTRYITSITLPTEGWAEFYYDMYEEQMWDFEQQFGRRPDLKLNGKTVTIDAVIIGDISRGQIDSMIYALDWLNNCPFLFRLFGE